MRWGWITLIPVDAPGAPEVSVMLNSKDGTYAIEAKHGPVPGPHRVMVHQVIEDVGRTAPSMDDAVRYDKARPGDSDGMSFTVKPGGNVLDLEIESR